MSDAFGKKTLWLVDLTQPRCQLEYGTTNTAGTCEAVLGTTGTRKCFNTRLTCQDPDNYDPADQTLRFSLPNDQLTAYGNVIPSLASVPSISPAVINLAGMDENTSPLGSRESVTLKFTDHLYSDNLTDKYRLERATGDASLEASGTAQAGTSNSLTLAADNTVDPTGKQIRLLTGPGSVQRNTCQSFDEVTGKAVMEEAWGIGTNAKALQLQAAATTQHLSNTSPTGLANDAITVEMRMRIDDVGVGSFFCLRHAWVTNGWLFGLSSIGKYQWGIGDASNVQHNAISDDVLPIGTVVHILGAYDGATLTLYVDGVAQTHTASLATSTLNTSSSITLEWSGVTHGDATVDDIRIYDRGLSAAEALQRFQNAEITDGLIAKLSCDEGTGTTAADTSGNSNDFTLLGDGPTWVDGIAITLPDDTTTYEVRDAYDPYARGTMWGKWLARNPYYISFPSYSVTVYRGYVGDDIEDMHARTYCIDSVSVSEGSVSVKVKDLFTKLDDKKSVAPAVTDGRLADDLAADGTSSTLSPTGIGDLDYPASGRVRIGDEVISFTRSGDTMTWGTRGDLNTEADTHDADDAVQLVLSYSSQEVQDIVYDLFTNYTPIPDANIDADEWDAAVTAAGFSNTYGAHITEPTPVQQLVGELAEQAGFSLYVDLETNMIKFVPLTAKAPNVIVTDREYIVDGSLSVKRNDTKRVSQVWVYYNQRDPTKKIDEATNYGSRYVTIDADAESDVEYSTPAVRKVFSRWIGLGGRTSATQTGERIVAMFRDPPVEAKFSVHKSRSDKFSPAGWFALETDMVQDDSGSPASVTHAVVSMEPGDTTVSLSSQSMVPFEADDERNIFIDSDTFNVNLRELHDSLFIAPTGTETVNFFVQSGVIVGSTSTSTYALRTGDWPAGVTLSMDVEGRILGKGGSGGQGGGTSSRNGGDGEDGGDAFLAEFDITIDNTGGIIEAGSGGGGGGPSVKSTEAGQTWDLAGGPGGGGEGSAPGSAGVNLTAHGSNHNHQSSAAAAGTTSAGGGGGSGGFSTDAGHGGGGGTGGSNASDGADGVTYGVNTAAGWVLVAGGTPGSGGSAGNAVEGDAMITWTALGTIRGARV